MATPRRFSEEQIERANRVDVVEYAKSMGHQMKRSGNWYKAKGQGGLYFNRAANTWHWEVEGVGGVGAISLCMELENKTWIEAVKTLLNEEMEPIRHAHDWKPEPESPREFKLPDVNNTYKHMTAYLTKTRGIEPSVLKAMIDRKYIYENTKNSCVFVGRDKEGIAHHASVRSTNTTGKVFKQDVPGSDKSYSFNIHGNSGILNVFEAPIDLLSYVSLQKLLGKQTRDSYVALGGTTDRALERFLKDYPDIQKIRICTDNDIPLNAKWDAQETDKIAYIKKTNMVKGKETDLEILFRTCNDYSRYVERNLEAETYYFSLPKDRLRFAQNGEVYACNVVGDNQYILYKSINDFEEEKGFAVSGKELYEKYLYEMPAGDKAAARIHERYGNDYKVTRHRPTNKDFNEDLIAYRNEQIQEQQEEPIDHFIKGNCEFLIICDSKEEMDALREIKTRIMRMSYDVRDYVPNESYLVYSNNEEVKRILSENPQITKIKVETHLEQERIIETNIKTEFSDMYKEASFGNLDGCTSFSAYLTQMKAIEEVIEHSPIDDMQLEQAVGIEA